VNEALTLRHNPGNFFTEPGFYGISPQTTYLDSSEQLTDLPAPRKETAEAERERVFEVFDELRKALRKRFREQLCDASDEAEAIGDPAIVPLKDEARTACLKIASIAADRCFYADRLQLVATAKINGGAVFVGRNPVNARRIDVEIEPGGSSAEFVATQRAETVSEFSYDLDEDVFRSWLDWLLRPS
jgi:hypothetical protein